MNTKELIIESLGKTEPFLEHEGNLFKMFDKITVKPLTCYRKKKIGLFKTETEEYIGGIEVEFGYNGKVVSRLVREGVNFYNGDCLDLCSLAGVIRVEVSEA